MSDDLTKSHFQTDSSEAFRQTAQNNLSGWLAIAGCAGGILLFLDLAVQAFRPLGRSYFILAMLMALFLPCVPAAYFKRGAIAGGWAHRFAMAGMAFVVLGAGMWLFAFAMLFQFPERAFAQHLTPGGSLLMAVGMMVFGAATLSSKRLPVARSVWPLLVGAYFPLQLIVQLTFFLNGKDGAAGPNGMLLGSWGLIWALAASAVLTGKNGSAPQERSDLQLNPAKAGRHDQWFILLALFCLLAGVSLGIFMGIMHDYLLTPVHAHVNLLGWASLALFGLCYRAFPELGKGWSANLHLLLCGSAAVLLPAGIALSILKEFPGLAIGASLVWLAGCLVFLTKWIRMISLAPARALNSGISR